MINDYQRLILRSLLAILRVLYRGNGGRLEGGEGVMADLEKELGMRR